jgi:hypothetical protein
MLPGRVLCHEPDLSPPERAVAQVEGWILGVSGLIRADQQRDDCLQSEYV